MKCARTSIASALVVGAGIAVALALAVVGVAAAGDDVVVLAACVAVAGGAASGDTQETATVRANAMQQESQANMRAGRWYELVMFPRSFLRCAQSYRLEFARRFRASSHLHAVAVARCRTFVPSA
jgi:hypothetical protein